MANFHGRRLLTLALSSALLASCTEVSQGFVRPKLDLSAQFATSSPSKGRAQDFAAQDQWWKSLNDPKLDALISRALNQNIDLKTSVSRIAEAEATLRTVDPGFDLSGSATAAYRATWGYGRPLSSSQILLSPSFIVDLFGERRNLTNQAIAAVDAAKFDEAAARIALQSAVTQTYLQLRYLQAEELHRLNFISNRARVSEQVQLSFNLQEATKYELSRAEAELMKSRTSLPRIRGEIEQTILSLATLLAEPAGPLLSELGKFAKLPLPKSNTNPGIPAALLQNRPDIRAAEARYAQAVSEVSIQEARRYPTLSLTGTVTISSPQTAVLGPSLSVPLFDRPIRRARRDAALHAMKTAELNWQQTVLNAVEEVQQALSQIIHLERQISSLSTATKHYREAAELSRDAFSLGAITFTEISESEDDLNEAELTLSQTKRNFALAWVRLNISIGQGWQAEE